MADKTADELVRKCVSTMREGADFPTLWQTMLSHHPLVAGPPIQGVESGRVCLRIPLVTSQWLVFDSTSKEFWLFRR
jgi:hypothetical protein